jgi:hypothetical protein
VRTTVILGVLLLCIESWWENSSGLRICGDSPVSKGGVAYATGSPRILPSWCALYMCKAHCNPSNQSYMGTRSHPFRACAHFFPSTIEDLHSFTYPAQRFQQLSIPLKVVLASWRTRYLRSSSTTASRSQRWALEPSRRKGYPV